MITFREGLEAFLVISIAITWLRKTDRRNLVPAVWAGVALALIVSAALGIWFSRVGALSPFWDGVMALVAATFVLYCALHAMKMGRFMKSEITRGLDSTGGEHARAWLLAFGFAAFMVGREGIETATMIASLAQQAENLHMAVGGVIGVALAALLAGLWVRFGQRIKLSRFLQLMAVFMLVFSVQLLIHAFHEFSEAGALPGLDNAWWHVVTEPWGPEGDYGRWISYSLGLIPLGWLIHSWLVDRPAPSARQGAQ